MAELRRFLRVAKEYRMEYGPFPFSGRDNEVQPGVIKDIGGGGLMFQSQEPFPEGRQLFFKIFIMGWRLEGDDVVEAEGENTEAAITAIAQVLWSEFDAKEECYKIGVEFLGRILT